MTTSASNNHFARKDWGELKTNAVLAEKSYRNRYRVFSPRGQHLCKFIGTKESVCVRKDFNSHRTGLGHEHGRRFIVLGHQYGRHDVM